MEVPTTYYRLKNYFSVAETISSRLELQFDRASAQAKKSGTNVYYSVLFYHEDMPYVCSIDINAKFSQCMVYKIYKMKNGFEVLAFHKYSRTYFLFSAHFMQRYVERFLLHKFQPAEVVKHFADNNPVLVFSKKVEKKKDLNRFTAMSRMGLMYCWQEKGSNLITLDTIINHIDLSLVKKNAQKGLKKNFVRASEVVNHSVFQSR